MKIGMVSREYPPFFGGGVGTYVHQISRAFVAAGHEVHVFTVATGKTDRVADPPGVHVHRVFFEPPDPSETTLMGQWTVANRWFHAADLFREQLLQFTEENKLDIVEFPEWEAPGWMLLLDWRWTIPSVVNCHTPTWLLQNLNRQPPLHGQLFEKLELALADGVCAPCTPMARRVEDGVELENPVTVVHHPYFAEDVLADYSAPGGKRILYVGRLENRKGVVYLIEAMKKVLAKHPDAELVLVGGDTPTAPEGGSMHEYLDAVIEPDLAARIFFVDNTPAEELFAFYRSALFCVFPSIFENFPNVCLEAMAAGRTAVVGNDSGMVEMIGDAGIHIPPKDAGRLAQEMISLLDNPDRAVKLGKKAYQRVREVFDPQRQAQARADFYQSVLDRTGPTVSLDRRLDRVAPSVWREAAPEMGRTIRVLFTGKVESTSQFNVPAERLIRKMIPLMKPGEAIHIALYGAGQHTHKLLPHLGDLAEKGIHVKMILDDNPDRVGQLLGTLLIAAPDDIDPTGIDYIVLSSDAVEPLLWEKSKSLRQQGLKVIRLYSHHQN